MSEPLAKKIRWLSFQTHGFGRLKGRWEFDPGKLNLIVGHNEAGKSTLTAGLTSALFGMQYDKRKRLLPGNKPFADDYLPWLGSGFDLELEMEYNGRHLLIVRNLEERSLKVVEAGISDVSAEFLTSKNRDTLGEALTGGLSVSGYLRSFVINQEQAALLSAPGDLVKKIQEVVTASPGDSTVRNAIEHLEHALNHVAFPPLASNPVKAKTVHDRISHRLAELEDELLHMERQQREHNDVLDEYNRKQQTLEQVREDIRKVNKGYHLAQVSILEKRIHNVSHARHKLEELIDEHKKLEVYQGFPVDLIRKFDSQYERYLEAYEQGKHVGDNLQREEADLERLRLQLSEFEELRAIDYDSIPEINGLLNEWRKLHVQYEKQEAEYDKEREKLVTDGIPPVRLEKIRVKRERWPEKAAVDLEDLQTNLNVAERILKETEDKRAEYDLPGRKFRFTPQVITIVLISILASLGAALEWQLLANALWALAISGAAMITVIILALSEHIPHRKKANEFRKAHQQAQVEVERKERALQEYVEALGEDSVETVLDLLHDIKKYGSRGDKYFEKQAVYQNLQDQVRQISDALKPYLEHSDYYVIGEEPTRGVIDGFMSRLQLYGRKMEEIRGVEQKVEAHREEANRDKERVMEYWNRLKSILAEVNIDIGEDAELSAELFHRQAEKAQRLRELDKEIRNLERDSEDEKTLVQLQRRRDELNRLLLGMNGVEAIEGEADDLKEKLENLEQQSRELYQDISEDRVRLINLTDKGPQQKRKIEEEIHYLRRCKASLELQTNVLNDTIKELATVERDVFKDAARLLNQRLEPILADVIPKWKNSVFDNKLHLQVSDPESGKQLDSGDVERLLSTGARDALFLGARMALSDFLAGGSVDAPYVLDEPFAHLDDARFINGMKLLIDRVHAGNQVIVMTCHSSRHDQWLNELDEELRSNVNLVELEGALS